MGSFSLKDQLFNKQKVTQLALEIKKVHPSFAHNEFITHVCKHFPELELKQRIEHIATSLHIYLPETYEDALAIILAALPSPLDETKNDNDFGDFIYAPYATYISRYGCISAYLHESLDALKQITMRFSVEDAIRTFINTFPGETMKMLKIWSVDTNYHVRRLASEGTRPKLPWAKKINILYSDSLPILHNLYTDKTRYVTRSVANHLNDISKINPQWVIDILKKWQQTKKQTEKEMSYIMRHALRTLIKQGNKEAMNLLGIRSVPELKSIKLKMQNITISMGTHLDFTLSFLSSKQQRLIIDYSIIFLTKNNTRSQKVFKLKSIDAKKNEVIQIHKKHLMRQFMTTRTLYAGTHTLTIQINGDEVAQSNFELVNQST